MTQSCHTRVSPQQINETNLTFKLNLLTKHQYLAKTIIQGHIRLSMELSKHMILHLVCDFFPYNGRIKINKIGSFFIFT